MSKTDGSMRAVFFALGGNTLISIIKFVVAFITGSSAMLAESIHSSSDAMNQVFLLIGNKRSKKKPDENHPFGYQKESFFWALMVAILLFFVGACFSIYEGIHKMIHPESLKNIYWIFIVLIVSIVIEGKSFMVAYKEFRIKSKKRFVKAIEDLTDTNLMVILMEDFAALTGLVIVLITTLLTLINPIFDSIGSIFVGLLLITISYKLTNEIRKLIVGESISREDRNKIKNIIHSYGIVEHIIKVQTMVIGNNKFHVYITIDVDNESTGYTIEDTIDQIKTDIKNEIPEVDMIHIEIQDLNRSVNL